MAYITDKGIFEHMRKRAMPYIMKKHGGNGYPRGSNQVSNPSGGVGGSYGGGNGGDTGNGGNATYYGSGGGGGSKYISDIGELTLYNGGSGYQGIVYMRIPEEQAA